jgi:DNA-binding XRE family transcriptional regulator
MKNKKITAEEYLSEKIGKRGSARREEHREKAYAFYLSEILKSRRKELKLSQEEVAKKVGKKRPYISRVENGEDVRISNFVQIANALGLSFELKAV